MGKKMNTRKRGFCMILAMFIVFVVLGVSIYVEDKMFCPSREWIEYIYQTTKYSQRTTYYD